MFEYYKSYKFFDAINDNKLKIYEYEEYKDSGYKDKTPKWIDTVIDD